MQTVIQTTVQPDPTMQTVDQINEQLNLIEFPDITSFKKALYQFTTLLAVHYNLIDRDILTKLSTIENNLFLCLQKRDNNECLHRWNAAMMELRKAIEMARKSI